MFVRMPDKRPLCLNYQCLLNQINYVCLIYRHFVFQLFKHLCFHTWFISHLKADRKTFGWYLNTLKCPLLVWWNLSSAQSTDVHEHQPVFFVFAQTSVCVGDLNAWKRATRLHLSMLTVKRINFEKPRRSNVGKMDY